MNASNHLGRLRPSAGLSSPLKSAILAAAKATEIPTGESGLWAIRRFICKSPLEVPRYGRTVTLPPGPYTQLFRCTEAKMHLPAVGWDCVMEDSLPELNRHLQFMLAAHGRVLITGLGLGCVVRGTLANPAVDHVTVIERDPDVLKLVKPHMPAGRLTIIQADALSWIKGNDRRFHCAWHDVWSDPDRKEPHLQIIHSKLILSLKGRVLFQGAWELPRWYRRRGYNLI